MPRGIKGSGKAKAPKATRTNARSNGESAIPNDGKARCHIDQSVLENGTCTACRRRALKFARIATLEAELRQLKSKPCSVCEAPGARASRHHPEPMCKACRKLASQELKLSRKIATAKARA